MDDGIVVLATGHLSQSPKIRVMTPTGLLAANGHLYTIKSI